MILPIVATACCLTGTASGRQLSEFTGKHRTNYQLLYN